LLTIPSFEIVRPRSLEAALEAIAAGGILISGGTDVVPNLKRGLLDPKRVVSLRQVAELKGVRIDDGGELVIGAGTTLAELALDPRVRQTWPALAQSAELVASPAIRNVATLGGNVCLDTRCPYYDQTAFWREALGHCLKTCGQVCHVVPSGRRCVAAFSADTPPVLIAYGASLTIASPRGRRTLRLDELYVADGVKNTTRTPDEIVVEVRVPRPADGTRASYVKVRSRASIDFPALSIAVAVGVDAGNAVHTISLVVGALGARPRVVDGLGPIAIGRPLDPATIEAIAERARAACHPLDNVDVDAQWRRAVLPVHVRRALQAMVAAP
jgi:4-hydroxybenzoyl-CoA reductase subunit beta